MKNMKIGTRMIIVSILCLTGMVAITLLGLSGMSNISAKSAQMSDRDFPNLLLAQDWKQDSYEVIVSANLMLRTSDQSVVQSQLQYLGELSKKGLNTLAQLEKNITDDKGKALLQNLKNQRDVYVNTSPEFVKFILAGQKAEADENLTNRLYPVHLEFMKKLQAVIDHEADLAHVSAKEADQISHSARIPILVLTAIVMVMGLAMPYVVTRSMTVPINEAVRTAEAIANGDLSHEVKPRARDEAGQLLSALDNTVTKLSSVMLGIKDSAESINVATLEIASGNSDLSSRTEQQASSLEETASAMEELTSTVKQNAENARQANQLAAGASDVAVKGGSVIRQVVDTMDGISTSSKKIADIIGVIDGIAFQTNILALNAAVEAARAGEQGRGFAVVASEVRNLAQRSAAAAKEIKELITDSTSKVDAGTALVDQAGKTMDEIVASVKRVTDIMSEIAAASHEQSTGIEEVGNAVSQMDEVTQQNAALVEEAAAAAESLEEQANKLVTAVSVFKFSRNDSSFGQPVSPHIEARTERKAPGSAKVARLPAKANRTPHTSTSHTPSPRPKKTVGGDDEWTEF